MGRRGRGEGAIYKENSSGLWAAAVEVEAEDGSRKRKVVRSRDKGQVIAKLAELQVQQAKGLELLSGTLTVHKWLDYWVGQIIPGTVKPLTLKTYQERVTNWIRPNLDDVPLVKLEPTHVGAMIRRLEAKGLAPRTQAHARDTLSYALNAAIRYGKLHRNVARLTDPPRAPKTKLDDSLSADEAEEVLRAAKGSRLEALALLLLSLGLRQAETLDLRWDDVDLKAGTLRVTDAKTEDGKRTLVLPPYLTQALKAHRTRQKAERLAAPFWVDPGLVFPTCEGRRYDRRNILDWWHRLTVRAGIGRHRMHASRHTAATLLLNRGVRLEVISHMLGHSTYSITADIYAKVRPQAMAEAAEAMQGLFGAVAIA